MWLFSALLRPENKVTLIKNKSGDLVVAERMFIPISNIQGIPLAYSIRHSKDHSCLVLRSLFCFDDQKGSMRNQDGADTSIHLFNRVDSEGGEIFLLRFPTESSKLAIIESRL